MICQRSNVVFIDNENSNCFPQSIKCFYEITVRQVTSCFQELDGSNYIASQQYMFRKVF